MLLKRKTDHASALHAGVFLPETAFEEKQRKWQSTSNRVCFNCVEKRPCKVCEKWKCASEYTDNEWRHAAWKESVNGKCIACVHIQKKSIGFVICAKKSAWCQTSACGK